MLKTGAMINKDKQNILDHGYVQYIEHWGSDERVIESARMSTDKGFLGWGTTEKPGDEKLLKYLYEHKHSTPFEFSGLTIELQAPIFVFREWHRHRTQSYSELSARYTPMPDFNYVPTVERLMLVNQVNKQASTLKGSERLTLEAALEWLTELQSTYDECERVYQKGLAIGVPKELARLPVPVARYSRMRATANLRNWLGFMTLHNTDGAQWEIREYAKQVSSLIKETFPRTWELYNNSAK